MNRIPRHLATLGGLGLGLSSVGSYMLTEDHDPAFAIKACTRSLRMVSAGISILADYKYSLYNENEHLPAYTSLKSQIHQRSADRLLGAILKSGGAYIKLGQHIASLDYLLPDEYVRTMRVLQDQCIPSHMDDINDMFVRDLGSSIDDLFLDFDPVPIGVASLAQVHRATLRDGRQVAVKCQHPSIRKYSLLDIELTSRFVLLVKFLFPQFEFDWLAHEMRDNLPLELDFKHEASNANRVRTNFETSNDEASFFYSKLNVKIPQVYWADHRILCMEFCEGKRIDDLEYMHANGLHPHQVGCELSRLFTEMIFRHGFLHADPHPGNLLIHARSPERETVITRLLNKVSGRRPFEIVVLDHGLYRALDAEFQLNYAHLWLGLIHQSEGEIRKWSRRIAPNVDMYQLFACMLTGRSWDTITAEGGIKRAKSASEQGQVATDVAVYMREIAAILARLPRPLLLIFKTNDLLRSVYRSLNVSEWASISVFSLAGYQAVLRGSGDLGLYERIWLRVESLVIGVCVLIYMST